MPLVLNLLSGFVLGRDQTLNSILCLSHKTTLQAMTVKMILMIVGGYVQEGYEC